MIDDFNKDTVYGCIVKMLGEQFSENKQFHLTHFFGAIDAACERLNIDRTDALSLLSEYHTSDSCVSSKPLRTPPVIRELPYRNTGNPSPDPPE